MREFDDWVRKTAKENILAIEDHLTADVIFFYGPIYPSLEKKFRDFIEQLKSDNSARNRLAVILDSPGGSAETVEKLVHIVRYHYDEVFFVIPDEAMSAGTIFALSGDRIYMDYTSSLGPIDPQVYNGKEWVPALGYLDQVEKMLSKSAKKELTDAELVILQNLDLAMLSRYEQAKNLTGTLLKEWLVEYKFRDWVVHESDTAKKGQLVTREEKEERAENIANLLSDNKLWHSHGRKIGLRTLQDVLQLKIEDFSNDEPFRKKVRTYTEFITDYLTRHGIQSFLHNRVFF
ncbi:MAG: serine dehydrogenasease [Chlorobaculum sp.]|jgi:membrane-bound ClpP family serine protease|nr:serine dehydrogenasease [Chlorobaculum sp.]